MTNEEKIKSMSTEELAKGIKSLLASCLECPAFKTCFNTLEDKTCLERMKEWLKEEMDEGENEMSAELIKPCPICGGKAEQGYKPYYGYVVYCPNCGIGTGYNDTGKQAIKAWNRRVNDDKGASNTENDE